MDWKPGSRLKARSGGGEFVLVRPSSHGGDLRCGGHGMASIDEVAATGPAPNGELADPVLVGKRYFDELSGLELLATKAGVGTLTLDGRKMAPKGVKALPASD
jgi:hypothetical protein